MPELKVNKVSYHGGHSAEYCDHAAQSSKLEEIVETYLENGFSHFAITEHAPTFDDSYLYPEEIKLGRTAQFMRSRFREYFTSARLQILEKYSSKAEILFGFETEAYSESVLENNLDLIKIYSPDLVVLSVHHVRDLPIDYDVQSYNAALQASGSLDQLYQDYYDLQFKLIKGFAEQHLETPIIIGHFDLIKIFSSKFTKQGLLYSWHDFSTELKKKLERNINAAVQAGFIFEVNSRAFQKNLTEAYPSERLLELIAAHSGLVTIGDDSHGPKDIGVGYQEALKIIRRNFKSLTYIQKNNAPKPKVLQCEI